MNIKKLFYDETFLSVVSVFFVLFGLWIIIFSLILGVVSIAQGDELQTPFPVDGQGFYTHAPSASEDENGVSKACYHYVYGYLEHQCWEPLQTPCEPSDPNAWECPVPFDSRWVQVIDGRIKGRFASEECDSHYRACRETVGDLWARIFYLEALLNQ